MKQRLLSMLRQCLGVSVDGSLDDVHTDIHGRQIPGAEVFFYPQTIRGVPVFDIESVLKHYRADIKKLERFVPVGDHQRVDGGRKLFDVMYRDVIHRFAEYAHLIPASEDHHHRGPGGLLIHSLESAYNALVYAENKKFVKSGFVEIDKEMATRARYAAWVGGLLHDMGKILRDIHVDAVDVVADIGKGQVQPAISVPTWMPHMETLIDWAKTHKVATYSVSFIRNRKHNQHNVESGQLLPYIIGRSHALRYLVEAPSANLYSEVNRVLTGLDTESYLSKAVREGDTFSTMKDMTVYYDAMLGVRNMSVGSRICVLMKLAKVTWEWNTPGGSGWIIAGNCYLQWPTAIQSIIKASVEHNISIPHDRMALVNLMENHGLIKTFDEKHRTLKFAKGQYADEDVELVATGKKDVRWEELIRLSWDGHLFGDDPKPSSCKGLMYLPETGEFLIIERNGSARCVMHASINEGVAEDVVQGAEIETKHEQGVAGKSVRQAKLPAPEKSTQAPAKSTKSSDSPVAKPPADLERKQGTLVTVKAHSFKVDTIESGDSGTPRSKETKNITFARLKQVNDDTEIGAGKVRSDESQADKQPIDTSTQEAPSPLPLALQQLIGKGAVFYSFGGRYYLEVDESKGIGSAELKAIKAQHIHTEGAGANLLAQSVVLGGKAVIVATLKAATGKRLEAAGQVVRIEQTAVEATTDVKSKASPEIRPPLEPIASEHKANLTISATEQKSAGKSSELTSQVSFELDDSPPMKGNRATPYDDTVYAEGTLGWILSQAGIDIGAPTIEFEKRLVKDACKAKGKQIKWSQIGHPIKAARHSFEDIDGAIVRVTPEALNTVYWEAV